MQKRLFALCVAGLIWTAALPACTTVQRETITLSATKAATLARAAYIVPCGAVKPAHDAGTLTGAKFNRAKALCGRADDALDAADAALIMGRDAAAVTSITQALDALDDLKTITGA